MKHRDLLVAAIFVATILASGFAQAAGPYQLTCSNTGTDVLQGALNGTSPWTTPGALHPVVAGDIVELHGFCQGDVVVTTAAAVPLSGFTIGNRSNDISYDGADGINGQIEIKNAQLTLQGLNLESGQNGVTLTGSDFASVYARDNASVILTGDTVGPGPLMGVYVMHGSSAQIIRSVINGNGTANTANENDGIRVQASSSVILGISGVGAGTVVENNIGNGITLLSGSSLEAYTATFVDNGDCAIQCASQVYMSGASTALLAGVSQFNSPSTSTLQPPLIEVLGASSLTINGSSAVEATTAGGVSSSALLVASASSVVLNSATIATTGATPGKPVIEASDGSSIVLASNNTICAGTYSNPTCTPSAGGTAIQIDHSSSLQQQQPAALGYFGGTTETITGAGSVQMQSSMDLGLGNVSGSPSITWTLGSGEIINVQQNSSLRFQGGVSIEGGNGVKVQQGSNAFFNTNNLGTNTAVITCTNTANNPMAHVSNPSSVSSVTTYNLNDLLTGVSGAGHPGQINSCLNF